MPIYDYKYLLCEQANIKDGQYTTNQKDFGYPNPNLGATGKFGLHVLVTTAVAGATEGIIIWVFHGAAENPTTKHVGRFFTLASLTAGKHYFIPIPKTVNQYVRAGVAKVGANDVTTGNFTMWLGPDEDGTE